MRIPDRIKVGSLWWTVRMVPQRDLGSDTDGDQSTDTMEIRIRENLPDGQKALVLFHELMHIIDSQLDHDLVELLSSSLFYILDENDLLAK